MLWRCQTLYTCCCTQSPASPAPSLLHSTPRVSQTLKHITRYNQDVKRRDRTEHEDQDQYTKEDTQGVRVLPKGD
jgi:hypothetical protein